MSTKKTKKTSKFLRYLKRAGWIVVLAGLSWFISYSIEQYKEAGAAEGIVVCDAGDEECILTTHIHSDITFDLCGETTVLPRETGELDGLHTHKEKNYLHFHDKVGLEYDTYHTSGERNWLFEDSLTIQEIIDIFELDPLAFCGTDQVKIEVLVNDIAVPEQLEYNWKDGDDVHLVYTKL